MVNKACRDHIHRSQTCDLWESKCVLCESFTEIIGVIPPEECVFEKTVMSMCKQAMIKSIMQCNSLKIPPSDHAGIVTGQTSHYITGCWQWWRLKLSLMEQQQGMGLCQGAGQDRQDRGLERGPESKQLPGKVTWNPEPSASLQVQICVSTGWRTKTLTVAPLAGTLQAEPTGNISDISQLNDSTHLIVYNLDIRYDKAHKQFLINSVVCRLSWAVFAMSHNYRGQLKPKPLIQTNAALR